MGGGAVPSSQPELSSRPAAPLSRPAASLALPHFMAQPQHSGWQQSMQRHQVRTAGGRRFRWRQHPRAHAPCSNLCLLCCHMLTCAGALHPLSRAKHPFRRPSSSHSSGNDSWRRRRLLPHCASASQPTQPMVAPNLPPLLPGHRCALLASSQAADACRRTIREPMRSTHEPPTKSAATMPCFFLCPCSARKRTPFWWHQA